MSESSNAQTIEWDFCDRDFDGVSSVSLLGTLNGLGRTLDMDLVELGGYWYAFVTSWNQNKIYRLRFGYGLSELPTEIVDLGNPGNILNQPVSINVVYRSSKWYILVHNWGTSSISRIDLGFNLLDLPSTGVTLVNAAGGFPTKMNIVNTSNELKAGLVQANGSIRIVDFKNDPELPVTASDISNTSPIPGVTSARDLAFMKKGDTWFAFVSAFNPAAVHRLDFVGGLAGGNANSPLQVAGANFSGRINSIAVTESGLGFYLHVLTLEGGLFKIKLPSITSIPAVGDIVRYGQEVNYAEGYVLEFVKDKGKWRGYTFQDNLANAPKLYGIRSEFDCGESAKFSSDVIASVSYSKAGTYAVTLRAISAERHISILTKEITVTSTRAPTVDFYVSTVCQVAPINFLPSADQTLKSYDWSFGDSNASDLAAPSHQYSAAGNYIVNLEVEGTNGCKNSVQKELTVYSPPIADFVIPPNLLCTNNEFIFPSTTIDDFDGNLTYQWFVDGAPAGAEQTLRYTFTTPGPKDIMLRTAIPGCSDEVTKTTSSVEVGPVVDFDFSGACEDEPFSFQNRVSDPVIEYFWDFDNGHTSDLPNPSQVYTEFGNFSVSLTATSAIGCNNTRTKQVMVHSKPIVDFTVEGLSDGCSLTTTYFDNQTTNPDGAQMTWTWDYADEADPGSADGEHVFSSSGIYAVSLTATSEYGCIGSGEKTITILPSPSTDFAYTPACEDVPTTFTAPSDVNIEDAYWEAGTSYYNGLSATHTFPAPGDYPFYAEFYGSNGCISTITKTIHVPAPLKPDFSVIKNCVNKEAVFTDLTTGVDPVVSSAWDIGDGVLLVGPAVSYTFTQPGTANVTLRVTAQSGCAYQVNKQIDIVSPPIAGFSASPPAGAYPLEITFTNTSSMATNFSWQFNDGTGATSTERHPVYTFAEDGSYSIQLTAFNAQQCEDSFEAVINTIAPLPDVALEMINVASNPDGTSKLIVTIHNKGNTILKGLPLDITFDGEFGLRQIIESPILPATRFNFIFTTSIVNLQSLRFLCASLTVENDLSPADNRICREFEGTLLVVPVYPNPAAGTLNIQVIGDADKSVRISLCDRLGRNVVSAAIMVAAGLHSETLDVSGLENGLYFLTVDDGTAKNTQRIIVSNER